MDSREAIAKIFAQAVNIAEHFEAAVQPAGNFESSFDNLFKSDYGAKIAEEMDKAFISHDTTPEKVLLALTKARGHVAATYRAPLFAKDADEAGKRSRPDMESDPDKTANIPGSKDWDGSKAEDGKFEARESAENAFRPNAEHPEGEGFIDKADHTNNTESASIEANHEAPMPETDEKQPEAEQPKNDESIDEADGYRHWSEEHQSS